MSSKLGFCKNVFCVKIFYNALFFGTSSCAKLLTYKTKTANGFTQIFCGKIGFIHSSQT